MNGLAPEVIHQRPLVAMFTAPNPGPKTLSGTHTYVLGDADAYVVDPGPADGEYQRQLAGWLRAHGISVASILLTHGHPDHAPGAALLTDLVSASVWASSSMPTEQRRQAAVDRLYAEEQVFPMSPDALQVVPSPGHTPDHVALWMPRARILLSGDAVLGEGTSVIAPPEGDMAAYMNTLARLRGLGARVIAPGHGSLITDPDAKFSEYVEHRRRREQQILAALHEGPATVFELVARIYTDVDPRLHALAARSVEAQLAKLVQEGRVRHTGNTFVASVSGS